MDDRIIAGWEIYTRSVHGVDLYHYVRIAAAYYNEPVRAQVGPVGPVGDSLAKAGMNLSSWDDCEALQFAWSLLA